MMLFVTFAIVWSADHISIHEGGNATLDFTLNLFGPHCARNVGRHQIRPGVQ